MLKEIKNVSVPSTLFEELGKHPFNLKRGGGGLWFFGEKIISVCKFDWKQISVSEMDHRKLLILTFGTLKT